MHIFMNLQIITFMHQDEPPQLEVVGFVLKKRL